MNSIFLGEHDVFGCHVVTSTKGAVLRVNGMAEGGGSEGPASPFSPCTYAFPTPINKKIQGEDPLSAFCVLIGSSCALAGNLCTAWHTFS